MFKDQVITDGTAQQRAEGKRLFWVTKSSLMENFWKDLWAFSSELERSDVQERIVNVWTYRKFTNYLKGGFKTWAKTYDQYGIPYGANYKVQKRVPLTIEGQEVEVSGTTAILRNTILVVDEAHFLFEWPTAGDAESPEIDELVTALNTAYIELANWPEQRPKLVLLTATPVGKDLTSLFKLYNLLIPDNRRVPETMDDYYKLCDDKGKLTPAGKERFELLTTGLVCCYNGYTDPSRFAQVQWEPYVPAQGNAIQLQQIVNKCGSKEKPKRGDAEGARCRLRVSNWAGQYSASRLPASANLLSDKFDASETRNLLLGTRSLKTAQKETGIRKLKKVKQADYV
jgi:hypothetical protein